MHNESAGAANENRPAALDRMLNSVKRPSQYIGTEINSVRKDPEKTDTRMALCFPDLYDIGMSHLGLKILYHIVNKMDGMAAERVFAPDTDYEDLLRTSGIPLTTLESHTPVRDFDILGFTIPYELIYTNIVNILSLSGIPLESESRTEADPLVIGGGACVFNPEPVAPFFDMFVLGDGEESLPAIMRLVRDMKKSGANRQAIIAASARIDGVYVPSFYTPAYSTTGDLMRVEPGDAPDKVLKTYIRDLNDSPFPTDMLVPFGKPAQDRVSIEIDRGCTQACRYCQAGMTYRPVRERTVDNILGNIDKTLESTGFDEVSLASLSSSDYGNLDLLLLELMNKYHGKHISVSLPSLRSGSLSDSLLAQIARVRKTGITITAEAGSQRLRDVLNKKITEPEIVETIRQLLRGGWESAKIYFMIGLPTEAMEDVDEINRLCSRLLDVSESGKRLKNLTVSVSNFVPKPHTSFQWAPMDTPETLDSKIDFLRTLFKRNRRITPRFHNSKMSYLEGVFARGDRRLAAAIAAAHKLGCKFDQWSEKFRPDLWDQAFAETGLDKSYYAARIRPPAEPFPWDHIDSRIRRDKLARDLRVGLSAKIFPDCRTGKCLECGIPGNGADRVLTASEPERLERARKLAIEIFADGKKSPPPEKTLRAKYRLKFSRTGLARHLAHLEWIRLAGRLLRRAGIPVAYSQGFHPHPRISFGPALPVGFESEAEYLDIETKIDLKPESILANLHAKPLPAGINALDAARIAPDTPSIESSIVMTVYTARIPAGAMEAVRQNSSKPPAEIHKSLKSVSILSETELEFAVDNTLPTAERARPVELAGMITGISADTVRENLFFRKKSVNFRV